MHRKWLINRTNREYISYLSNASSISPAISQVLINRGIKTPTEVKAFLSPDIRAMQSPSEIEGIAVAVEAIMEAKKAGKKILVHGDYDVDGLTATSIMTSCLRRLGLDVHYFIPNRFIHGYGFSLHAVRLAKEISASLIITVDCGITSFEAVDAAKKEGISVIITDHHEPEKTHTGVRVPSALAVINPKLTDSMPMQRNLSGAGVAFKLAQALVLTPNLRGEYEFLDLASLGTLADSVPLIGENRIILREGLNLIREGVNPGIKALKSVSGLDGREIKAENLSYTILPRINASGRISDASEVVELLLTDKEDTALAIAQSLNRKNSERQKIEEAVYNEAIAMLNQKAIGHAIVLWAENWHEGVIGIVAGRIAEKFHRPAFILSIKDGMAKGSARSIPEFDIHRGLSDCKGLLVSFGGHRQAGGLKLSIDNLNRFEEKITSLVELEVKDFTPGLEIDADISVNEITFGLAKELSLLEPFGYGNSVPLFGSKNLTPINPRIVGENHLKMKLKGNGKAVEAIGFDMGGFLENLDSSNVLDAVYTVDINEWEGGRTLQINLKALRPAEA